MDKFELDGKTYVANVPPLPYNLCSGCAFDPLPICCAKVQECCAEHREDGKDIIWVEAKGGEMYICWNCDRWCTDNDDPSTEIGGLLYCPDCAAEVE